MQPETCASEELFMVQMNLSSYEKLLFPVRWPVFVQMSLMHVCFQVNQRVDLYWWREGCGEAHASLQGHTRVIR